MIKMKDYTFKVPQDIVFGVGSLKRLPELLEKSGSKKMMVVSDRGLEKLGVVQKVLDIVEAEGIERNGAKDGKNNESAGEAAGRLCLG